MLCTQLGCPLTNFKYCYLNIFFGLVFGEMLLCHADNLSRTLQKPCSASEGQSIADMTRKTLQKMRSEENFGLFWQKINRLTADLDIGILQFQRYHEEERCQNDLKLVMPFQSFLVNLKIITVVYVLRDWT